MISLVCIHYLGSHVILQPSLLRKSVKVVIFTFSNPYWHSIVFKHNRKCQIIFYLFSITFINFSVSLGWIKIGFNQLFLF